MLDLARVRFLAETPEYRMGRRWRAAHSDSVLAWSVAAKLALEHVAGGHVVPAVRAAGPGAGVAYWRLTGSDDGRLASLVRAMPAAAHALLRDEDEATVWSPEDLLVAFCDAVADTCARTPSVKPVRTASFEQRLAAALTGSDPVVELPDEGIAEDLDRWSASVTRHGGRAAARLCVQLHTPDSEEPDARWPLVYHLQATDDPSLVVPAEEVWATGSASMRVLGREVEDPQESLVRGLAEAARLFPPLGESLAERRPAVLERG